MVAIKIKEGEYIWIYPANTSSGFNLPIGAEVLSEDDGRIQARDDHGEEHVLAIDGMTKIRKMNPASVTDTENMILLGDLNEEGMLRNLYLRYKDNKIYTYTSSILVAVNPYEVLPIYTPEDIKMYRGKRMGEMPPHIFAIADNSFNNMIRFEHDQCIIISGESGAGKTESTKLILQFLAAVSGQHSWIEQQILEANPIMEAFGNAKTIRNDNSSRFGKYIDIHFNVWGSIEGAMIDHYLLEKTRIVHQAREERNYHIFYCMLAGMSDDEKKQLDVTMADDYWYLTQGGSTTCGSRDDKKQYSEIMDAMKILLFTEEERWDVIKILTALLHLGNVNFNAIAMDNIDDASEVTESVHINKVCKLIGIRTQDLKYGLTKKTIVTRGDSVTSTMGVEQSMDVRDAFVKGIYGELFIWIVKKINEAVFKPKKNAGQYRKSIGVLDIFGFESFDVNSFEQLCINYANENLQQFFVQHIFKTEQDEYDHEGINWQHIEFVDNQDVLDLIGAKSMNIISLVDEESKFPKGTDQTMLEKLNRTHENNKNYVRTKANIHQKFGVSHFAGVVFYDTEGFLEKNRDTFPLTLKEFLCKSTNTFLANLFKVQITATSTVKLQALKSTNDQHKKGIPTLGGQFKKSLEALMKTLNQCHPFFIRCIKPNEFKKAMVFDRELCYRQLRYSGMMETISIRKVGYPVRHSFHEFVDRYRILAPGIGLLNTEDSKEASIKICEKILSGYDYQIGRKKVFLKDAQDSQLENRRESALSGGIFVLQKFIRMWRVRKRFLKIHDIAAIIQSRVRMYVERKRFLTMKQGFVRLQCVARSKAVVTEYAAQRKFVIRLQSYCHGYVVRKLAAQRLQAVIKLQARIRTFIQIREFRKLRIGYLKRVEAEQLKDAEERRLKVKLGEKKAKLEAERQYKKRISRIEKDIEQETQREREEAKRKQEQMQKNANRKTSQQTRKSRTESQLIDEMFDIFEDDDEGDLKMPNKSAYLTTDEESDVFIETVPGIKEDLTEFSFAKFASTYFQGNVTHNFIRRPLKNPLLPLKSEMDQQAALAVWICILRFMGDLPEPKTENVPQNKDKTPIMARIYATLGRKWSKQDLLEARRMHIDIGNVASVGGSSYGHSRHLSATKSEVTRGLRSSSSHYEFMQRPTSNLEKLHFIIGHGLIREELRDEIYCQIVKQLINNPSEKSQARGWILVSLCAGCFAPSDKFIRYLRNFIKAGPPGYGSYCEGRLLRTHANGPRSQPPSWLELQATKVRKHVIVPITLPDDTTINLAADSASTAQELCNQISEKIGLRDQLGFSLFISILEKVSSIGSKGDHVMDAISQCEQYTKEQGALEANALWKMFFRKEIFSPWHDPSDDVIATNMIYQQVIRGIKSGEYKCDKDADLSMIVAQRVFIEIPGIPTAKQSGRINTILDNALPNNLMNKPETKAKWKDQVLSRLQSTYFNNKPNDQKVKGDVVRFAMHNWPLMFSRFFDAFSIKGPAVTPSEAIIAINWKGFYVITNQEKTLLELTFPEIISATTSRSSKARAYDLILSTARGHSYHVTSTRAEDIHDLLLSFLEGLKQRSRYVVAIQDYMPKEKSFLSFEKGDLIVLTEGTGQELSSLGWSFGKCTRTQKKGDFPTDSVHVLPTIAQPSPDLQALFKQSFDVNQLNEPKVEKVNEMEEEEQPHTLEHYAMDHFRPAPKEPTNKLITSVRKRRPTELWRHSKEPLLQPLLRKLMGRREASQDACACFICILKYTGDLPSKRVTAMELVDQIFGPPLQMDIMKDEIYCQIIKQLTENYTSTNDGRGWELLWLATGCFVPSSGLLKEVMMFLESKRHPLAIDCIHRINKTMRHGSRKLPPHAVEIDCIKHQSIQLMHRVSFPDDSEELFEIESCTRGQDLSDAIAAKLKLKTAKGFNLFVKMDDKVLSVPMEEFFFDFIRKLTDWVLKTKADTSDTTATSRYQVFFMRKMWTNTVPGRDINADIIFHYPQEMPKLLRGYHKCSADEAARLAALIFRVRFGDAKVEEVQHLPKLLRDLVPADLVRKQTPDVWTKRIMAFYVGDEGLSKNDAKIELLKFIYKWPTFGSAFFDVRQTSLSNHPEYLTVAINKKGILLLHPGSKDILSSYPFTKISNWSSGVSHFTLSLGNMMRGTKLLCETTMGYRMADLLSSYIDLLMKKMDTDKP